MRLAPWADCCYATDAAWWRVHKGVPSYTGLKFSLESEAGRWPGVTVLQNTGHEGIETHPAGLRTGRNSGAAAVNLAVHFGASRILLLGFDMGVTHRGQTHFFGNHPSSLRNRSPYSLFLKSFEAMVAPLQALNVQVVNCSRATSLNCFPRHPLECVLQPLRQAVSA